MKTKTLITRSRIVEVISDALRTVQYEDGIKIDLSNAILLIDQGILNNTESMTELLGFKVYSAGYISHIAEAIVAFPEEATEAEERFMHKFIQAMQLNSIVDL